jgi:hypothetical protein
VASKAVIVVLVLLSGGGAFAKPPAGPPPIKVTASKRIGRLLSPAVLPFDAGKTPTLFWVGADLCVVQEESPARFMRCYATSSGRWKERTAVVLPQADGRALRTWIAPNSSICPTGEVVAFTGPQIPVDSCPIEAHAVLGVVAGPALLLEQGTKKRAPVVARLDHGKSDVSEIPAASATAGTPGTRVVGDGCCRLVGPDRLRMLGDHQKEWSFLGPPPPGQGWREAVASPDQQWIAVQASADGAQAQELWLMKVERR